MNESTKNTSSNSSSKGNSLVMFLSKVVISLLLLGYGLHICVEMGIICRKETEKKDLDLNSNVIFYLIAALDDQRWALNAMVHLWSKEYGIKEAQNKSSEFLQSKLSISNVWVAYILAESTGDKGLLNATEVFISKNFQKTILDTIWLEQVFTKISQAAEGFQLVF
ncbi:unnamed protein product [Larinioides sclopetarius]|uniref:Uncharacterized protein n=1 Tax=Larinioides sclopetarius TaxID=280406 RepID=A0AAV2BNI6_9ARAC